MNAVNSIIRKGTLVSPQIVKLDEPAQGVAADVEIILHVVSESVRDEETIFDYVARITPGTKSRAELDAQLAEERAAWGDR